MGEVCYVVVGVRAVGKAGDGLVVHARGIAVLARGRCAVTIPILFRIVADLHIVYQSAASIPEHQVNVIIDGTWWIADDQVLAWLEVGDGSTSAENQHNAAPWAREVQRLRSAVLHLQNPTCEIHGGASRVVQLDPFVATCDRAIAGNGIERDTIPPCVIAPILLGVGDHFIDYHTGHGLSAGMGNQRPEDEDNRDGNRAPAAHVLLLPRCET